MALPNEPGWLYADAIHFPEGNEILRILSDGAGNYRVEGMPGDPFPSLREVYDACSIFMPTPPWRPRSPPRPRDRATQLPPPVLPPQFVKFESLEKMQKPISILALNPPDWYMEFFIRMDRGGSFHTYPPLGGPFQTLPEAEDAINGHLTQLRKRTIFKEEEGVSHVDMLIRRSLYWPDGTRKRGLRSVLSKNAFNKERQMAQVLLDIYNDDHNLHGDLAYVLKDVVLDQTICEDHRWYYHFNFTAKTKEADVLDCGPNDLFFAEISHMQGEDQRVVSCCCLVNPNDNGLCYGCKNEGSVDMKHPSNTELFVGGHVDGYLPFGGDVSSDEDSEEDDEAWLRDEEARLRHLFKGLDDPNFRERICTPPPYATPMTETH